MKQTLVIAVAGLLAWQANATGITRDAFVPGATGWTAPGLTPDHFDSSRGAFFSVRSGFDGQALLTTSLPNNTLLTVAFAVGTSFFLDHPLPGGLPLALGQDLSQDLSLPSDARPGLNAFGSMPAAETSTTDLSAWEGRGSVALRNGAVGVAGTEVVSAPRSATSSNPAATNGETSDAVRAMPDGPLPWWASLGGLAVVFWLAARQRKLPKPSNAWLC